MGSAILGGVIGAAGSIFGGSEAADAANKATALQSQIRSQNVANEQPFITAGNNALNTYGNAIGLNGSGAQNAYYANFQNDPYYQNTLKAGTNAITNSAAARGTLYGGNTLSAVNDYGGNLQMNAYNNRLGQIGNVMNQGANSANALAGTTTSSGNSQAQNMIQAGQFTGNSIIGAANAGIAGLNNYNKLNAYNGNIGATYPTPNFSSGFSDNYANIGNSLAF